MWMHLCLLFVLMASSLRAEFHLVTVCNLPNKENYARLADSAEKLGYRLHVLGQGEPWFGYVTRFYRLEAFLSQIPDDDIVLHTDAFDVFLVAKPEEILEKFHSFGAKLVISTEKNCFPADGKAGNPVRQTDFCYLNGGGYIGYAGYLKALFRSMQPYSNTCDQHCLMYHFAKNQELLKGPDIQFDQYCKIFLSLYLVPREDIEVQGQRLYLHPTDSYPCVVHGNGPAKEACFSLYRETYGIASFPARPHHPTTSEVHLVSASPLTDADLYSPLEESVRLQGLKLSVLGQGEAWPSDIQKFRHMEAFLSQVPDDTLVLFTETGYSFVLGGQEEIVEKFRRFNAQLVFSMEKNCFPEEGRQGNPPAETPFRYLHAGGYIGYAGFIKALLRDMQPYGSGNPQLCLMHYFMKHPEWLTSAAIQFDQFCELFLPLYLVEKSELELRDQRIYLRTTGEYPCIVCGNGPAKAEAVRLYPQIRRVRETPLDPADPRWAWMDRQIEEDFRDIKRIDRFDVLRDSKKLHDMTLYQIRKGRVFGHDTQTNKTTRFLHEVAARYPLPDIAFLYLTQDICRLSDHQQAGVKVPVFSSAKEKQASGRVVHFIDWYYDPTCTHEGWNKLIEEIDVHRSSFPWENKEPKLFWRGGVSETGREFYTQLSDCFRGILVAKSLEFSHLIDARFTGLANWNTQTHFPLDPWIPVADHLAYKYQMVMDGVTATYPGYQWRLYSGCVPFKQESDETLWFEGALEPWVHFVPVRHDLSNLAERITWAREHDNEAREIAKRARRFSEENLMPEHMYLYAYKALMKYASLYSSNM